MTHRPKFSPAGSGSAAFLRRGRQRLRAGGLVLALALGACQTVPPATSPQDLRAELRPKTGAEPPQTPEGACWAADTTPAVIETVTEQILVEPEQRGPDGAVLRAAVFRTETQQKIVQDRREVWFRAPCPADMTLEFVATLQRALKARGLYLAPLTGQLDAETLTAIRRYQEPLGLDSDQISLAAARGLGIIAGDFGQGAALQGISGAQQDPL